MISVAGRSQYYVITLGNRRVSMLNELVESDFLKISRSPDFDHFRSIERLGETKSIPLDCRGFAAGFAALRLKTCSVYLQRTFPRILQARYSTSGAFVVFPMDDTASVILNGVEAARRLSCWSRATPIARSSSRRPI